MTTITHTYTKEGNKTTFERARTGGPRNPRNTGSSQSNPSDWFERYTMQANYGSHMPLDVHLHWEWRNPLNIIPAFMFAMILAAVIGLLLG